MTKSKQTPIDIFSKNAQLPFFLKNINNIKINQRKTKLKDTYYKITKYY